MVKAKYIICGVSNEGTTMIMGLSSDNVDEKYLNLKVIHQKEIEEKNINLKRSKFRKMCADMKQYLNKRTNKS